jgi:hypothetical protein
MSPNSSTFTKKKDETNVITRGMGGLLEEVKRRDPVPVSLRMKYQ